MGCINSTSAANIEEGIKRWKKEDDSIDDTTAIVVFLNYKK